MMKVAAGRRPRIFHGGAIGWIGFRCIGVRTRSILLPEFGADRVIWGWKVGRRHIGHLGLIIGGGVRANIVGSDEECVIRRICGYNGFCELGILGHDTRLQKCQGFIRRVETYWRVQLLFRITCSKPVVIPNVRRRHWIPGDKLLLLFGGVYLL